MRLAPTVLHSTFLALLVWTASGCTPPAPGCLDDEDCDATKEHYCDEAEGICKTAGASGEGGLNKPCFPSGRCDNELTCVENVCVVPGGGSTSSSSGGSSSATSLPGSSSMQSSSSSAGPSSGGGGASSSSGGTSSSMDTSSSGVSSSSALASSSSTEGSSSSEAGSSSSLVMASSQMPGSSSAPPSSMMGSSSSAAASSSGATSSSSMMTPLTVSFAGTGTAVTEADTNVEVFVTLSAPAASSLDIPLVYGGTATGMQDYASGPTMVGFAQGATTASFTVSIRDDADIEGAETIQITLQSGAGATPATPSQHVITINDNDEDTMVSPEVEITSPADGALVFTSPVQVTGWCEYGATLTIEVSEGFSGMSPSPTPPPVNCVACTTAEHPDCGTGPNQRGKFQFSVAPGGSSGPRSLTISQEDAAMNAGTPVTLNLQWAPLPTAGAYIKASNTNAQDTFGFSVDIDGDTMVVGAPSEASAATGVGGNQADNSLTNAGAVYVFVRSGGAWTQQAYIKASNTGANDAFGSSVALSGDTLVVGAPQESSSATGVNGDGLNDAAPASGAAYVFVRTGSQWSQQAYIKASNTGFVDLFGVSVAIDGDVVVVGASGESSSATGVGGNQTDDSAVSAGAAYVFERAGTMWSQTAYLKASNTEANDSFGSAVAVSGDVVAVGAPFEAGTATNINGNGSSNGASGAGAVYLFTGNSGVWSAGPYVKASNTDAGDGFGTSVALAPGTLVVGAPFEQSNATGVNGNQSSNAADSAGAVYVLREVGGTWQHHAYLKASNTGAQDHFGASVAISQDTILVGADSEDGTGTGVNPNGATDTASGAGAAYVFQHALDGSWQPKAYLKASNTGAGDNFGRWVSVSGTTLVVSAPYEASNATGIDGNQMSNTAASSGAVYTFDGR